MHMSSSFVVRQARGVVNDTKCIGWKPAAYESTSRFGRDQICQEPTCLQRWDLQRGEASATQRRKSIAVDSGEYSCACDYRTRVLRLLLGSLLSELCMTTRDAQQQLVTRELKLNVCRDPVFAVALVLQYADG